MYSPTRSAQDTADDNSHDEQNTTETALARLRLFLSPHAANTHSNEDTTGGNNNEESLPNSDGPNSRTKSGSEDDDTSADLSMSPFEPSKGEVSTVRPLSSLSKDYLRVRYFLHACLPGYKVHSESVKMWDMMNQNLSTEYNRMLMSCDDSSLELEGWINVGIDTRLEDSETKMSQVYSYGFASGSKSDSNNVYRGTKVGIGNIALEGKKNRGSSQMVLCRIAPGRSYVVDSEVDIKEVDLPVGYQSFYLESPSTPAGASNSNKKNPSNKSDGYYHEYILPNNAQILPMFLVQFSYEKVPTNGAQGNLAECFLCEKKTAEIQCKSCSASLCKACDDQVHESNKLLQRHKRVPFQHIQSSTILQSASKNPDSSNADNQRRKFSSTFSMIFKCPKHTDMQVDLFYCSTCAIPVCVYCKMIGDHSHGENSSHRLNSIYDAYEMNLKESMREDPLIASREKFLGEKVSAISKRKESILENAKIVELGIRQMMDEAVCQLKRETSKKLQVLEGEEVEYKRQMEQIIWAEGFLCEQRETNNALEFLNAWQQHKLLRQELRDYPTHPSYSLNNIKPDLQLVGRMQVVAGDEALVRTASPATDPSDESSTDGNGLRKHILTRGNSIDRPESVEISSPKESSHPCQISANNPLSPKSTELINKVKKELICGENSIKNKMNSKRYHTVNMSNNNEKEKNVISPKMHKGNFLHRRQKTQDVWTNQVKLEIEKEKLKTHQERQES